MSSRAAFDVLFITRSMTQRWNGVSEAEIHLLGYLSCLLSVLEGSPGSLWGYSFAATASATPFSLELNATIDQLLGAGLLEDVSGLFGETQRGRRELAIWTSLGRMSGTRSRYLDAACASTSSLTPPLVLEALRKDPQLETYREQAARPLLDESGVAMVQAHFQALKQVVGTWSTPLVPAVVWLSSLPASPRLVD